MQKNAEMSFRASEPLALSEAKGRNPVPSLRSGQASGFALRMTVMMPSAKICVLFIFYV